MKNNTKYFRYIFLFILMILTASFAIHTVEAKADFGDFSGGTDFGGSGSVVPLSDDSWAICSIKASDPTSSLV